MNAYESLGVFPSMLAANGTRAATKVPAVSRAVASHGFLNYDPDRVSLSQAAGGFNCAVEIAAEYCLRVFDKELALPEFGVSIRSPDLKGFLTSQNAAFQSVALNQLAPRLLASDSYMLSGV